MTEISNKEFLEASKKFSTLDNVIIDSILDRKGKKISHLNFKSLESAPSGAFIICQGNSTSQVASIADHIREKVLENTGMKPYNYDGYKNSQWVIIDYGNVMVHVFLPEYREYYNIEDLCSDADTTELPDLD